MNCDILKSNQTPSYHMRDINPQMKISIILFHDSNENSFNLNHTSEVFSFSGVARIRS